MKEVVRPYFYGLRYFTIRNLLMHNYQINYVFLYMPWPKWWDDKTYISSKGWKIPLDNSNQVWFLSLKANKIDHSLFRPMCILFQIAILFVERINLCKTLIFFFFNWDSPHGWTATTRHGVTRKEVQKGLQDTENLFRKNLQLNDVC